MSTKKYKKRATVDKGFWMPNNIDIITGGNMTPSKNIFMTGQPISEGSGGKVRHWIILFICELCFGIAIIWLYLGMRGVMRLGGFVASGGPYHIAHQAPGWTWMVFVSVFLGLIAVFVSFFATKRIGGPNLMVLAWSALFLSLGWNFAEFGIHPPGGDGLAWGWIICAICFIPMGLIPLLFIISHVRKHFRSRRDIQSQSDARGQNMKKERQDGSLHWFFSSLPWDWEYIWGWGSSMPRSIRTNPIPNPQSRKPRANIQRKNHLTMALRWSLRMEAGSSP